MRNIKDRFSAHMDVRKASLYAIVVNALELVLMVAVLLFILLDNGASHKMLRLLAELAALVVCSGAVLDIRDALTIRKVAGQMIDLRSAIEDVEQLNIRLRAQRHDFLNHLQVVYSLMEMQEYDEANAYIERVYGDITTLSRALKTANPAINALLHVKLAACEKMGIRVDLHINSAWENLPVPGWELCKVLSNLLDNAMDALEGTASPCIGLTLTEDLRNFRFSVDNNGPAIPLNVQSRIFLPGITSKGEGHGMGLAIVRDTLRSYGGDIHVVSSTERTCFEGWIPKEAGEGVPPTAGAEPAPAHTGEEKTA